MEAIRERVLNSVIDIMECGLVPDRLIAAGIRRLCAERLKSFKRLSPEDAQKLEPAHASELGGAPVAVHTAAANTQHYEVPSRFFELALGPHRKYSCALWEDGTKSLAEAEAAALEQTMARAELEDGMRILELGAGWGSLSLAMAVKYPNAKITTVSNSRSQKEFIDRAASARGLKNVTVVTRDVAQVEDLRAEFDGPFDRVVSVEMFEHLRNYGELFRRISRALRPGGKLFVHIFTHRAYPYYFETEGEDNWMGKYFFTGGQMPSRNLLHYFQRDLTLEKQWRWDGTHYAKTSDAWLKNMDANRVEIRKLFRTTYGAMDADRWVQRWRIFFLACRELFAYDHGSEWFVSHYLFVKTGADV